jgi:hypothetical protein
MKKKSSPRSVDEDGSSTALDKARSAGPAFVPFGKLYRCVHPVASSSIGRTRHGKIMREATRLVEAGKLVPRTDPRHFKLGTVAEAHDAPTAGTNDGKIVIDIGDRVSRRLSLDIATPCLRRPAPNRPILQFSAD